MAEILAAATAATKFFLEVNQISIDNWTFKLYYKATVTLLLACSVVASSKQFFGDPINCEVTGGNVNDDVLNSYCWMYATFNIPLNFRGACSKREHDGSTIYNSYYQWVSIFLVITAIFFYMPRTIWLVVEGGLMKFLARGTTTKIVENADKKREGLIRTFAEHLHNKYNRYAMGFFICEQLNFLVVLGSWFVTNKFLHYSFLTYGPEVIRYYNIPEEERRLVNRNPNPMCETFPRIAACIYHRFGSGGGPEKKSALCVLGLNMINDKVFLVLWFWYFALTIFGVMRLIYRIVQLSSKTFRYYVMKMRIHRYFKSDINMMHVKWYLTHCSVGDWFVLYQMSRNMNTRFFSEFITVLSKKVNPCPNIDNRLEYSQEEGKEEEYNKLTYDYPNRACLENRRNSIRRARSVSDISFHSRLLDITFDDYIGEDQEQEDNGDTIQDEDEKRGKKEANNNNECSKCRQRNLAGSCEIDTESVRDESHALARWVQLNNNNNNNNSRGERMRRQQQQRHYTTPGRRLGSRFGSRRA